MSDDVFFFVISKSLGQQAHDRAFFFLPDDEEASSVDVTPSPSPPPPTTALPPSESVELGGRTATLVGEKLCWTDALLYCRRHHWDLLSLRSKEDQGQVEKLLSASPFPLTGSVWLGLRRYSALASSR